MARRDIGHASRSTTHASPWAETPAGSGESKPKPQWPEGSWWSQLPDPDERGRRARGPSRREMKRHEARIKRSRRRAEDPFGARNRPSAADGGHGPRARPPEGRAAGFGVRNDPPGSRSGTRSTRTDDARLNFGARGEGARDARTAFGAPSGGVEDARTGFGARTRQFVSPWADEPDARTRDFDVRGRRGRRTEQFDAEFDAKFDAAFGGEELGSGRDRSREFPPRGKRPEKSFREDERPARRRPESRKAAGAKARRPAAPRPGPKAMPRRRRNPADRMSVGAIVLSTAVGLALLGIAERALLEGGPIGGVSGPAGSERALDPPEKGGASAQPRPSSPQRSGQPGAPAGQNASPNLEVLAAQVRKLTVDERSAVARQSYGVQPAGDPIVNVTRTSADKTWVFGTTALPVPAGSSAAPEVAFYAARWTGTEWQVALSGNRQFATLLGAAPANVMPAAEAAALRRYGAVTAEQATALVNGSRAGDRLVLPWKTGQAWAMTTSDGAARPLGSLAFSGGDGRVLAAGTGRLYRFCSDSAGNAMVVLVHRSGLATTYYRLRNIVRVRDGGVVRQGAPLGVTGTERPCGGAASPRAEVGFGLRRGGGTVPLDGAQIGGWTFRERANPLIGFAERGALQVLPGGLMANLGALPIGEEDDPAASPSARPSADDDAGSTPAPQAGASQKRSQSGANSQQ